MDIETIKTRLKAVRRQMLAKHLDCLILTSSENVCYLTGFTGHDSWAMVSTGRVWLITDSRYTQQAQTQSIGCRIIQRDRPLTKAAAQLLGRCKSLQSVAVENCCSLADFKELKKHTKLHLKSTANIVEDIRQVKQASEINAIRRAAKTAFSALTETICQIRTGMTENELAGLIDFQIRKLGSQNSFETIVAFGANASCPHHQSGRRKLRKTDTILIDFGAKYKGYCSDLTRCFAVGKAGGFYKKVYRGVVEAQTAAIKKVKAGVSAKDVDAAARIALKSHNLPEYGHGTGHGLGLQIHEAPVVSHNSSAKLRAGQIVTIEPAVYIPGRLGIRIEDDVLVTQTGCKILSADKNYTPNNSVITLLA